MLKTVGNPSTRSGDQTILDGNLVIGTSGKGIDFSANSHAAGMTSELLDDYEEGTWTPAYTTDGVTFPAITMDVSATYTKIGRIVTVRAVVRTDNVDKTGVTGNLVITGLPFTCKGGGQSPISIASAYEFAANYPSTGYIETGNTIIYPQYKLALNSQDVNVQGQDLMSGALANRNQIVMSAIYFTDL